MKCQLPSSDLPWPSSSCATRHPSQIPSGISGSSSSAYSHFWPPSLAGTLPASGTIFVRSSKISLFFPELCSFRRVFCFPFFCKIWRKTFERWGFWFRRFLGALFGNSARSPGIFLRTPTTTSSKISFLFSKHSRVTGSTWMVIPRLNKAFWSSKVKENFTFNSGRWPAAR